MRDPASRTSPKRCELKPIDVLLCDHHYFGGFAGCQALGPICTAAGWTMSQHSNNHAGITMAAMIHLAASIPELTLASDTHYPWLVEGTDIIEGPKLTIRDGRDGRPGRPGARRHARSRQAVACARDLYEMRDARPRRPSADAKTRAWLDGASLRSVFGSLVPCRSTCLTRCGRPRTHPRGWRRPAR